MDTKKEITPVEVFEFFRKLNPDYSVTVSAELRWDSLVNAKEFRWTIWDGCMCYSGATLKEAFERATAKKEEETKTQEQILAEFRAFEATFKEAK